MLPSDLKIIQTYSSLKVSFVVASLLSFLQSSNLEVNNGAAMVGCAFGEVITTSYYTDCFLENSNLDSLNCVTVPIPAGKLEVDAISGCETHTVYDNNSTAAIISAGQYSSFFILGTNNILFI